MTNPATWSARRSKIWVVFVLVALLIVFPPLFGWFRDDYSRFDRRHFTAQSVIDGDTLVLADRHSTPVALLGVDAPDPPDAPFAAEAREWLAGRLSGRQVLLRLEGTQTRDESGRLRAYVYLTDSDLLNADIIRQGLAFADRRTRHTFAGQFEQLESEARAKRRGMWESLTDAEQPDWRRQWLKSRGQ